MRILSILLCAFTLTAVGSVASFAGDGKPCKDKEHCEHNHKCKTCKKKCNCKDHHDDEGEKEAKK